MSITIPQGGTAAGRSASVQIEQPDVGGFVAQVGSAVAQKMGQIKERQRAVVFENTQLEMTKELGQERLRFERMTDPAQIDAEWPEVQARIVDKYVNAKDEFGRPRLTPQEADALSLNLKSLTDKHALALGERAVNLTQGQARAEWMRAQPEVTAAAATADPDTLDALLAQGEATIARLGREAGKSEDQIVAEQQAFRGGIINARATTSLDEDPNAFIAAVDAGTYNDLGPERVAQLKVAAQAEIDRRAAAASAASEAEAKKRADAIDKRLGEIATMEGKGLKTSDRDWVISAPPEVQASERWAEARSRIDLHDSIPDLEQMTVAQLDEQIAAEEGRTYDYEWQASRLTVLRDMREKKTAALATDPKAALVASGVIPATDLTFDPANLETFTANLSEAISLDAHARGKGHTDRRAIFTTEERNNLKAILAPGADAGPKVALMTAILDGTGGDASGVLADLEADPVTRRALTVLNVTRDPYLTESILRGQQKIDGKTVVAPSRKQQVMAFDELTGGVFDDAPALKAELMEATLALYADNAKGIDGETQSTDGWIVDGEAYRVYEQSLRQLLGAQPDRNGNLTIGGLQEVNGTLTILPVGVSVEQVENAWEGLEKSLAGRRRAARHASGFGIILEDPPEDPMQPFRAASIDGGLPDLGSDPSGRFASLTLHRVGESDVYELVREHNGRIVKVTVQGGDHAYRFRLKDLVRVAKP